MEHFLRFKRGPKRGHYAYAKRQERYNTDGIVTNIVGNGARFPALTLNYASPTIITLHLAYIQRYP